MKKVASPQRLGLFTFSRSRLEGANRIRAKLFKIVGSGLILFSFGAQMYQNALASREQEKTESFELDARTTMKSLAYLNLYFTTRIATGQEDPSLLIGAAQQRVVGYTAREVTSDAPKKDITRRVNELTLALRTVRDLDSYNAFMRRFQQTQDATFISNTEQATAVHKGAGRALFVYATTFALGSFFLLFGILDE